MEHEIKIYDKEGLRVLEIYSLAFISDRNHKYGWLGLHFRHLRLKFLLKRVDKVYVPDYSVAIDLVKYYFYSRENIIVDRTILDSGQALSR